MNKLTWLHLSDLHLKTGPEAERYNQKVVLKTLWEDVRIRLQDGLQLDFIAFTGDVSYHGRKQEYELAVDQFFEPLLGVTGVPKSRLFLVPGNHDVEWGRIDPIISGGLAQCLVNPDFTSYFLGPEYVRDNALTKFSAYHDFVNTYLDGNLPASAKDYYYTREFEKNGHKIGIMGLNSAWMSACCKSPDGKATDQGNLLVGERQLEGALDAVRNADMIIALLHHPLSWLHEIDLFPIQRRLESKCDFVLHGHWHVPQVRFEHSISGRVVYIPAGAIYSDRRKVNTYNIVQTDLESGETNVFLRRYNDEGPSGPVWISDVLSTGEERGGVISSVLDRSARKVGAARQAAGGGSTSRILVVEDGEQWHKLIKDILVAPEYEVTIAASYAEARSRLPEGYDLVLVNLCLVDDSDWEGVALLEDMQALGDSRPPCIVLSGAGTSVSGLFQRFQVSDVFIKNRTFNRAEFRKCVKAAIASRNSADAISNR